jgi:hypothetical protein
MAAERWDEATQRRFHASHLPARGPLSPCMHRAEAATRSFTLVTVDRERAGIAWSSGPPCRSEPVRALSLARAPTVLSARS